MNNEIVIIIIAIIIVLGYVIFNKFKQYKSIDTLLYDYYITHELKITYLSGLSISEKIKYGVPINPFFRSYTVTLGVITNTKDSFFRKIETVDLSGGEQIRYVEISFNNSGFEVEEFDIYDF